MSAERAAAVGEAFGDLTQWRDEMFLVPNIPGARRVIGTFRLPDDLPYVDLDDARQLVTLGVRPSQVVERNLRYTQDLAARIYGEDRCKGIRWWSFHRPQWHIYCLWDVHPEIVEIEELNVVSSVVQDAARALVKLTV